MFSLNNLLLSCLFHIPQRFKGKQNYSEMFGHPPPNFRQQVSGKILNFLNNALELFSLDINTESASNLVTKKRWDSDNVRDVAVMRKYFCNVDYLRGRKVVWYVRGSGLIPMSGQCLKNLQIFALDLLEASDTNLRHRET